MVYKKGKKALQNNPLSLFVYIYIFAFIKVALTHVSSLILC